MFNSILNYVIIYNAKKTHNETSYNEKEKKMEHKI
jgi:hypothetical protein